MRASKHSYVIGVGVSIVCICVHVKDGNAANMGSDLPQIVAFEFFLSPVLVKTSVTVHSSPCYAVSSLPIIHLF